MPISVVIALVLLALVSGYAVGRSEYGRFIFEVRDADDFMGPVKKGKYDTRRADNVIDFQEAKAHRARKAGS